jgi:hypothetical protein
VDGAEEGITVGNMLGSIVGTSECWTVGNVLGAKLGDNVGDLLGFSEGTSECFTEG